MSDTAGYTVPVSAEPIVTPTVDETAAPVIALPIEVTDEESHPEVMPAFIPPTIPPLLVGTVDVPWVDLLPDVDLDRVMTPLTFMARLTDEENAAIAEAAMSNAMMFQMMLQMAAAQEINLDDPRTVGGVMAMVAAGILTTVRANEVLGQPA